VSENKQQESQEVDTPFELGSFFYISVGVIFVTMLALYISQFGISRATDQATWGAFGDFVGGTLNPLISFFTLIVAVSVWRLQRLQLVATQKELEETREAIKVQAFDQFFMSVLASHRAMSEQVSLIGISGSNTLQTGKRAIDSYRNYLTSHEHYFDIMLKQKISDTDGSVIREAEPNIRNKAGEALKNTFNVWRLPPDSAISMLSYFCIRYYKKPLSISNTFNLKPKSDELSFENIFGHIFRSTYQILKFNSVPTFSH
jgi:hypothetical protein